MATAKKLPSGNYRVRVYDKATGKYKSFTAQTKKAAELKASEYFSSMSNTPMCNKTVGELIDDYIDERRNARSPATIDKYERIKAEQLSGNFLSIRIAKITDEHIKQEVNRLCGKYSAKSVKNAFGFIAPIIRKQRPDLCKDIPLPKVYQKKKVYPTAEEVMNAFRDDKIELEVLLALCLGLRKEEIRGIKPTDFHGNTLTINRVRIDIRNQTITKNETKTQESMRQLEDIPQYIMDLAAERQGDFITTLSGQAIYKRFKRKMLKLGYDISFHDLRHINASIMLFLGVPDKYAMERGGWSSDDTLKKVYQATISSERKRFDRTINDYFQQIYDTKHDTSNCKRRIYRIKKLK